MDEVTSILSEIEAGSDLAAEKLLPLVYTELKRLAATRLASERPGQTLQATMLVHEAYLRLVDVNRAQNWNSRGHFFAAAAEAMRRILIESARRKRRLRHGGGRQRLPLDESLLISSEPDERILALDEALSRFTTLEPQKAEFLKLRFFGGCTVDEAADLLQLSRTTAQRWWVYARAWLLAELYRDGE